MSRIEHTFESLKNQGRTALVAFVTAGDPEPVVTVPLLHALVGAGADILELGVPFSDPMADGPVIQRASERALCNHVTLRDVLGMAEEFRATDADTPVVLMGYLNPIEVMGYVVFAQAAAKAGVDGVITVDLPPEEAQEFMPALRDNGLDPIFLVSPTSSEERIELITSAGSGFIYYVSLRGVTGAANLDVGAVGEKLKAIRKQTTLPVGVGFGINSPETAAAVAGFADAVVVGSALVKRVGELAGQPERMLTEIAGFVARLRSALDDVGTAA
ncbi:MAG: tryptophan synthase subunit alpha [Gammaproteobacteria bacterium]|nr:MAG: tryptophan synthase subunit alpha [Gammaproteobacteria bacterium]